MGPEDYWQSAFFASHQPSSSTKTHTAALLHEIPILRIISIGMRSYITMMPE